MVLNYPTKEKKKGVSNNSPFHAHKVDYSLWENPSMPTFVIKWAMETLRNLFLDSNISPSPKQR